MILELPHATTERAAFLVAHHLALAAAHFEILDETTAREACLTEVARIVQGPGFEAAVKFVETIDATFERLAEAHDTARYESDR